MHFSHLILIFLNNLFQLVDGILITQIGVIIRLLIVLLVFLVYKAPQRKYFLVEGLYLFCCKLFDWLNQLFLLNNLQGVQLNLFLFASYVLLQLQILLIEALHYSLIAWQLLKRLLHIQHRLRLQLTHLQVELLHFFRFCLISFVYFSIAGQFLNALLIDYL